MLLIIEIALGIVLGVILLTYWRQIIRFSIFGLLGIIALCLVMLFCIFFYKKIISIAPNFNFISFSFSSIAESLIIIAYASLVLYALWGGVKTIFNYKPIEKLDSLILKYKLLSNYNHKNTFVFLALLFCFYLAFYNLS